MLISLFGTTKQPEQFLPKLTITLVTSTFLKAWAVTECPKLSSLEDAFVLKTVKSKSNLDLETIWHATHLIRLFLENKFTLTLFREFFYYLQIWTKSSWINHQFSNKSKMCWGFKIRYRLSYFDFRLKFNKYFIYFSIQFSDIPK